MANAIRIDLSSDTASRPSQGMRAAMAVAEVGDEQRLEDPSVNALCRQVAGLLGKEAAMLLPSGIMCNLVAILTHCRPGDEIILADNAHIVGSEGGGACAIGGVQLACIPTEDGLFSADDVAARIRPARGRVPRSRLVSVEQTTNRGGGAVWPLQTLQAVSEVAKASGLSVHMDGARLVNAAVAAGLPAVEFAGPCDTVWLDLSKGLGCPIGGVLCGPKDFIEAAWTWKHRLGGAMRQAGVIAAAGLYALEHNVARLKDDHANAALFAERLAEVPGIRLLSPTIQTNIVFIDVSGTGMQAAALSDELLARGIRIGPVNERHMRAVTHLDVSRDDVIEAADTVRDIVANAQSS